MKIEYIRLISLLALMQVCVLYIGTGYLSVNYSQPRMITDRPIIGILTQPLEAEHSDLLDKVNEEQYIPTNYITFVHSAGGRVVPIPYNSTFEELELLASQLNGILFTGGSLDLFDKETNEMHQYTKAGWFLFEYAKKLNDRGIYFPLWGTCQGFQLLHILAANDSSVLGESNSWDFNINLDFKDDPFKARIFTDFSNILVKDLGRKNLTYHVNHYGIRPETYRRHSKLDRFFKVIATSKDEDNKDAIAVVEGKNYPFYAVQYHPEKSQFDFSPMLNIVHDSAAIETSYRFAKFFVDESKRNSNKFNSFDSEIKSLIENYRIYLKVFQIEGKEAYMRIYLI